MMEKITPMIAQYHQIKQEHPGAILLFRVGDFYETFFDDAVLVSKVLGIVLTARNHGKSNHVPLAGIPHHALERYITRLIKEGHKVAICDQVEDPKLAKGIVKRAVTEVITPGTLMRPSLLEERRENLLAAVKLRGTLCGLALCDLSAGNLRVTELPAADLADELNRSQPSEILVPKGQAEELKAWGVVRGITLQEDYHFDQETSRRRLLEHFQTASLAGFGCQDLELATAAAGAALRYLEDNQKTSVGHIAKLSPYSLSHQMQLDSATIRNLALLPESSPGQASLLEAIDRTLTPMGGRLLRRFLAAPLLSLPQIRMRQDAVESLVNSRQHREDLSVHLKKVQDLERLLGRITCHRAGPRDLLALAQSLEAAWQTRSSLPEGEYWVDQGQKIHQLADLCALIRKAVVPEPPLNFTQGGFINQGYHAELDQLNALASGDKSWIAGLQKTERERTGISSLKVGYNSVFGYYIEISKAHAGPVPQNFIRKQTLANAERYITEELKAYEDKVLGAEEKIRQLELELFNGLKEQVSRESLPIKETAEALAAIDAIFSLALAAVENGYRRPLVDEEDRLSIQGGRHPVVERSFRLGQFVANDALLDGNENRLIILTGPNMAGKSTYLRQIALIVILAQIGSFVPAQQAQIGITDRIFTRIGASDDLAKGVSTFLAEMNETANILNNAGGKSLVLLDEIGRGTSTFDGLAIAWAVSEYLHDQTRCKTLFATHYHELTELSSWMPGIKNYSMSVKQWGDEIIFLRQVVPGPAGQSYGVQVAKLAGLPKAVVERAREILFNLESDALSGDRTPRLARHQISQNEPGDRLFSRQEQAVLKEIKSVNPESLTPLEALNKLAKLKDMTKEDNNDG
jgi:DNA mismatch repair protein MutS